MTDAASTDRISFGYALLLAMRDFEAWLTRLDWMMVFGAVLIIGTIVIFLRLSRGSGAFSFADAFAGEGGKTSMAKIAMWVGTMTTSWIMVALTIADKMSTEIFGVYLFALVLGKVGTETVGVFRQGQIARTVEARGGGPDPAPEPQQVGTVNVNVPLMAATADANTTTRRPLGKQATRKDAP